MHISNDGGFGPGSTAWLSVDPAHPVYNGWALASYGDERLPGRVYTRFRDAAGARLGPFQDDIILDARRHLLWPAPPRTLSPEASRG